MSRQYQNQNYQSGHHQTPRTTSYPYPPQQHGLGQIPPPLPNTNADHPPSHHAHSPYPHSSYPDPETSLQYPPSGQRHASHSPYAGAVPIPEPSSLQYPPSGQRHASHSPYAGAVPIPEPQWGGSAGHPQVYIPPPQTTPNLNVPTHHRHHERRGSHGHSPTTASSSDSNRFYATGGSYTGGGGSNLYSQPGVQPHPGRGYNALDMQSQDPAEYEEGFDFQFRPRGPGNRKPSGTHRVPSQCRIPGCNAQVFFDRSINEWREWCSEAHMQAAIVDRVEKPCKTCGIWPRRLGSRYCGVDRCVYPYPQPY